MKFDWDITQLVAQELPELARFFKSQFKGLGGYGDMDLFQWKTFSNPVQTGVVNCIRADGEMASITSVTPKRLWLKGESAIVAEIGDTYTASQHQRKGMFALLINRSTQAALDRGITFVYGTPNKQSLPGYEAKANYKVMPNLNLRLLLFPVNIRYFLQKRMHWLLSAVLSMGYSVVAYPLFLIISYLRAPRGVTVRQLESLPENWDEFWESARVGQDFLLARDRAALSWRFFSNPNVYRFYVAEYRGKIVGYLFSRVLLDEKNSTLVIADFLCVKENAGAMRALLFEAVRAAFAAGIGNISAWCPRDTDSYRAFRAAGFLDRGNVPVICFQNEAAAQVNSSCNTWHFTVSDSDNI